VLGRTLDELPPQTQRLLGMTRELVAKLGREQGLGRGECRLMRRTIREHTGWGNTQLHMHLQRLVDLEYLVVHRGRRGLSYEYELLWDGEGLGGETFVLGLLDPEELRRSDYDQKFSGSREDLSGVIRGRSGADSGVIRGAENGRNGQSFQPLSAIGNGASAKHAVRERPAPIVADAGRSVARDA
jgi:hypothetical protein